MDRISAVCSLIRPSRNLADIGCDHGLVAAYALDFGIGEVIAADISEGSLQKARRLLAGRGNVRFVISDGFDGIPVRVEQAVVSGMGGQKIADIISRCPYRPALVLGAQHNVKELRVFLSGGGYRIVEDFCVCDRGKYYDFIRAEEGKADALDAVQLAYGAFYKRKNPYLYDFAAAAADKIKGYKLTDENRMRLEMLEEVLKWQR